MSLDIRPCNDEDVYNILHLILPHLAKAECRGKYSEFASINVETRIPGIRWCWQMHGNYMSFRPQGFPHGHIEFQAIILLDDSEYPPSLRCPGGSYVVCPPMLQAYRWIRETRGHQGKNRVAAFFPPEQTTITITTTTTNEEFERIPYEPPRSKPKPIQVNSFWSLLRYVGNKMFGDR